MSTPFVSKFFSKSGQVERLKNVGSTLKASITGKGVQANTPNKTVNKVLSAAASNPFTTAAVVTPINTLNAAKAGFSALSTRGKVLTVGAAIPVTSFLVSNPSAIGSIAETPRGLSNLGSNIAEFVKEPSIEKAKNIFKENPVIAGTIAGAAAVGVGAGAVAIGSNILNTAATKENTAAIEASNAANTIPDYAISPVSQNVTSAPTGLETQTISTSSRSIAKRKKKVIPQQIRQSVRVNVINANQSRIGNYIKRNAYA